ncbi:hypothetical protein PVK06_007757 [Gossypium arboreum]|uniref:Uncharacterized protein n=1 Tax=Gossypium arboreum TaxID=29729 RepID=A0ABR0QJK9_GOSAR|nr:hypothetical protein PVK06_007757 [Gossypium arboreum]
MGNQWFGARIFYKGSEEIEVDVFKKLEKRNVLSNVEKVGLVAVQVVVAGALVVGAAGWKKGRVEMMEQGDDDDLQKIIALHESNGIGRVELYFKLNIIEEGHGRSIFQAHLESKFSGAPNLYEVPSTFARIHHSQLEPKMHENIIDLLFGELPGDFNVVDYETGEPVHVGDIGQDILKYQPLTCMLEVKFDRMRGLKFSNYLHITLGYSTPFVTHSRQLAVGTQFLMKEVAILVIQVYNVKE